MHIHTRWIAPAFFSIVVSLCQLSCKKLVSVPEPVNSITTTEVFATDAQAASAMAGVYSLMINSSLSSSNGQVTLLGGMSSDELFYYGIGDVDITSFSPNKLLYNNSYTYNLWTTAYQVIYNANSVIEGIAASTSGGLTDSVRKELTAESKFVRAFCYFYLTNLFGDVPLALTVDFNKTRYMARTPVKQVYQQIIQDLKDAQSVLPLDYSAAGAAQERIVPNHWAATALLARAYLFTGDNADAAAQAGTVISNTALYSLVSDPNQVFLADSKEAIWQLKQGGVWPLYNGTQEGYTILPNPLATGTTNYCLAAPLLNAFEPGDLRRQDWVDSTTASGVPSVYNYYPYKYKIGSSNAVSGGPLSEYYMMLRLAEMYLIRAEAEVGGATGGAAAAIADLNVLRTRAGLPGLSSSLLPAQVTAAVAHERQVELFAEWGHRWLDLNRTGQAHNVLSVISTKQPWTGDFQLLYPIPSTEIMDDHFLLQNPGY